MNDSSPQWNTFVERYYGEVYRFLVHFLGSRTEGEDAVQEVFIKAWKGFASRSKEDSERAWIYSIARHHAIDRTRWWKRFLKHFSVGEVPDIAQHSNLSWDGDVHLILGLVQKLSPRQREIFVLRHWHGFSTSEVAQMLKLSEGSVKVHLKRAVDQVKSEFIASTEIKSSASITVERI